MRLSVLVWTGYQWRPAQLIVMLKWNNYGGVSITLGCGPIIYFYLLEHISLTIACCSITCQLKTSSACAAVGPWLVHTGVHASSIVAVTLVDI